MRKKYKLNTIYFYLTNGCNLNCRHCWTAPTCKPDAEKNKFLDVGLFKDIIEQAIPMGLSAVKFSGGEPLLHPGIEKMIEFIQQKNIFLIIETNGSLCSPALAKQISRCKGVGLAVSLDGVKAETHDNIRMVSGCFNKAIQGIKNLVDAGVYPQIIMSVMKENKDEIWPMIELSESLNAQSVKFNFVAPVSRGESLANQGLLLGIKEILFLHKWIDNDLGGMAKISVSTNLPLAFKSLGRIFDPAGIGCSRCDVFELLGVLADGSFALCGIGENLSQFVFGNANQQRVDEVWNNAPFLLQLREDLPLRLKGICSMCVLKNICLGYCVAMNYYVKREWLAPCWICEEAYRQGLFPDSRIINPTRFFKPN